jgi:uncharacterized membrane protein YdjX (TVP38/TMEM64 family)
MKLMTDENEKTQVKEPKKGFDYIKWLRNLAILAALVGIYLIVYYNNAEFRFNIHQIVDILRHADMLRLKYYLLHFGVWAPVVSALIMMFQSVAAPLPAFVVTLTNGLLFGAFWGTMLSWSSSMAGAVICFYIARWAGRPAAERFVSKRALNYVDRFFDHYGNNSVLITRLMPFVSFDAVSYAAGLTSISFWGFFWASAIGELPATILYSWLGQNMPTLVKFWFWAFLAVAALIVIALTVKKAIDIRIASKAKKDAAVEPAPVEPAA